MEGLICVCLEMFFCGRRCVQVVFGGGKRRPQVAAEQEKAGTRQQHNSGDLGKVRATCGRESAGGGVRKGKCERRAC